MFCADRVEHILLLAHSKVLKLIENYVTILELASNPVHESGIMLWKR